MNIIFYLVGGFLTFIGLVIYGFFKGSGTFVLNQSSLTELLITSAISAIAFFGTDYFFKKRS